MSEGLREELLELTASVRAYLQWHAATGASGLPPDSGEGARTSPPIHEGAAPTPAPARRYAPLPEAPRLQVQEPQAAAYPPEAAPPPPTPPPAAAPVLDARAERAPAPVVQPGAPGSADTLDERRARLALVAEEVRSCQKCALHSKRKQTVFSRGSPLSEIAFIGEGPGYEEDQRGEPFVGPAGQLLDRMIAAMGYARDEVYICNIVKCRPPENRKPEPAEMASCSPYLISQLAVLKPRVIVALGATAVQGLFGTTEGITRLRGKWKPYKGTTLVMPTFHPAYVLRQPSAKRDVWNDLKEVLRHLGKSLPERG